MSKTVKNSNNNYLKNNTDSNDEDYINEDQIDFSRQNSQLDLCKFIL